MIVLIAAITSTGYLGLMSLWRQINFQGNPVEPIMAEVPHSDSSSYLDNSNNLLSGRWTKFQGERKTEFMQENYELSEAFQSSLDGRSEHGIIIWHKKAEWAIDLPDDPLGIEETLIELFEIRHSDVFKTDDLLLPNYATLGTLYGKLKEGIDLDNSGSKEIVLTIDLGGNCRQCRFIKILRIDDGRLIEMSLNTGTSFIPTSIADLNGDGMFEIIALITLWEYGFADLTLCRACSPETYRIYALQEGRYTEDSPRFASFYHKKISKLEEELDSNHPPYNEDYIGKALSLYLHFIQVGKPQEGWLKFNQLMSVHEVQQEKRFQEIQSAIAEIHEFYSLDFVNSEQ